MVNNFVPLQFYCIFKIKSVAARYRTLEHWDRGFESRSRHECMSAIFYVVLYCVHRGLVICRLHLRFLPKCLKGFMFSEVNSESEQSRRPNPLNVKQKTKQCRSQWLRSLRSRKHSDGRFESRSRYCNFSAISVLCCHK